MTSSAMKSKLGPLFKQLKEPSQKTMISLSMVMLLFASIGALSAFPSFFSLKDKVTSHFMHEHEPPFLTDSRDEFQGGEFFLKNRMKLAPWLYGGAHIVPAMIWSILIPTQHSKYIRRNYIQFHRFSGWLIVISAITLSISGSLFPLFNLSYSDPDLFHVHWLIIPTQLLSFTKNPIYLPYPTFNLLLKPIPFLQVFPLYMAIKSIRMNKDIQNHKKWMIVHTVMGYLIPLQRIAMIFVMTTGWIIHSLPKDFKAHVEEAFNFPNENDLIKKYEIERSAFALTAVAAFLTSLVWIWRLLGNGNKGIKNL